MKTVSVESNQPVIKIIPEPICNDDQIIIELRSCGICGSDIGNILGVSSKPTEKIGHEVSGIIVKVGKNVKQYKIGERVILNHHCPCKNCHYCVHGNETMCKMFTEEIEPCGLSQRFRISGWIIENKGIFKIPDKISFNDATLVEPLSCCLRSWKKIKSQKNDKVMIFGFGTIGIMHSIIANERGLNRIIVEFDEFRREFGKKENFGEEFVDANKDLDEYDSKIDLCIIANSDISCIQKALKVLRKGGSILFFGEPKVNSKIKIDMSEFYSKEISLMTSYAAANDDFENAIKFLIEKHVEIAKLISHEFDFENVNEAIKLAENGKNRIKVVVSNNHTSI